MKHTLPKTRPSIKRYSRGFTMIEVGITMVILSVGLLGIAAMQTNGMKITLQSHQRSVALNQAQDLTDRIRANEKGIRKNYYVSPPTTCPADPEECTAVQTAISDMTIWQAEIAASLPSGTGELVCFDTLGVSDPDLTDLDPGFTCAITIRWDGNGLGVNGTGCDPTITADLLCLRTSFLP